MKLNSEQRNKTNAMNWIKVTDRLPEKDERVLCFEFGIIITAKYIKRKSNSKALVFMDEQDEQPLELFPTHWMPLPEPPKD